jgi:hypothetical protein
VPLTVLLVLAGVPAFDDMRGRWLAAGQGSAAER